MKDNMQFSDISGPEFFKINERLKCTKCNIRLSLEGLVKRKSKKEGVEFEHYICPRCLSGKYLTSVVIGSGLYVKGYGGNFI